jgi:TPR repeat protein
MKAALQGHKGAQNNVGFSLARGLGVRQDFKQALFWYLKAAAQGLPESQYLAGDALEHGEGSTVDRRSAKSWYEKAAAQGHAKANAALARLRNQRV